ncbi:MAG: Sec-independent protein translocase subunit TatA [Dermatophilaceae bacterium]
MGKGLIEPWHIVVLILVLVVLFGGKKLPDAARSLGRSMRIFKSEVEEMKKDGKSTPSAASSDTVKGETVDPAPQPTPQPPPSPTPDTVADPTGRETHNQPPA